jgi:hypothetical protein
MAIARPRPWEAPVTRAVFGEEVTGSVIDMGGVFSW